MNRNTLKTAALLAAGAFLGAAPALALDGKVVLDQLVKKGVLTPEEADAIVKSDLEKNKANPAPAPVLTKTSDVNSIRITGGVQAQGKYTTHQNLGVNSNGITPGSGVELRRFQIGVEAKVFNNWTVFGQIEGDAGNNGTNSNGNTAATTNGPNGQNGVQLTNGSRYDFIIDKAGISYDTEGYGTLTAAVQKTKFSFEEYCSSFDIYTIERSPVSFYFGSYYQTGANGSKTALTGNTTIGGRKVGFYYDKAADHDGGFTYGAGISNAYEDSYTSQTNSTEENYAPEFYANLGYVWKINEESSLETDVNLAYTEANTGQITDGTGIIAGSVSVANPLGTNNGSSIAGAGGALSGTTNTNADFDTKTVGIEWLTKYKYGRLTLVSDLMAAYIQNGRYDTNGAPGHADNAMPFGATATAAYRVTDSLEPLAQFGYLTTDGRGLTEGGVVRDYNGTTATAYDRAYNVFAGIAWYITPKSLKLTTGFEATQFEGLAHGATLPAGAASSVRDYGVRMQLQARF